MQFNEKNDNNDEFLRYLAREKLFNQFKIHGLTEAEELILNSIIATQKETLNEEDNMFNETERYVPKFDRYTYIINNDRFYINNFNI